MKRLFLALWPESDTRQELTALGRRLDLNTGRLVASYNLHVTLVFIGSVSEAMVPGLIEQMDQVAAEPFSIVFDALDFWRKPKVLCLTSSKPPTSLMQLAEKLNVIVKDCHIETDPRPYKPHITLARHVKNKPDLRVQPLTWSADSYCLVESISTLQGVLYQVIQTWAFKKE